MAVPRAKHVVSCERYDDALSWLYINAGCDLIAECLGDGPLPLIGSFICDAFWVHDAQFRKDMRALNSQLMGRSNFREVG
ncbi:MAG: hypothetical protein QM656_16050 [Paracoccaceae bacterium]